MHVPSGRSVRVLHFLPWLGRGGVEVALRRLIQNLPQERYSHHIACIEVNGDRRRDFDALGVPITVLGGRGSVTNWKALLRFTQLTRSWRPHIVHGCVFEGQVFGTLAGRLASVPVVITEETTYPAPPGDRSRVTRIVLRQLLLRNQAVVAITPAVASYLTRVNGLPETLVHTIRHGVEAPPSPSAETLIALRERFAIPQRGVVVGTVCRLLDRHKRVSDLIRALRYLHAQDITMVVVGDGPDRSMLNALATTEGVAERLRFLGHQDNPTPFFYLMDIFALPSAYEGFGVVFAEAAACGIPCIGTAVGGIVDAIDDEVTGLLVPPSDPSALAAAIGRLAANPALRRRMGEAGAWRVQRLYSVEAYAKAFDELFRRSLALDGAAREPARATRQS